MFLIDVQDIIYIVNKKDKAHTNDEIKLIMHESYKNGLMDKTEYTYVDNIFSFSNKNVKDILVPRIDMACVFINDSFETILEMTTKMKFSRYPVCDGDRDHVIGFINIRDLYEQKIINNINSIDEIIRKIITVPEGTPINEMLKIFQHEKENIALVIDEYTGTEGIVTIEDVLEEIVGDIKNEYD